MKHPIEVPPELFAEWLAEGYQESPSHNPGLVAAYVARKAAEWAADQQLEKCCEWLNFYAAFAEAADLRAAMRLKPPSLKEQALAELEEIMDELHEVTGSGFTASAIRRALESIPDES
jgi:hypothetical protein